MRKIISSLFLFAVLLSVAIALMYPAYLNVMCGRDVDVLKSCGRLIFHALDQNGISGKKLWPVDGSSCPRTSKELIESVASAIERDAVDVSESYRKHPIPLSKLASLWIVVKNLPENAPDNLPVILSRNVDPASLTNHVSVDDFERSIRFNKQYSKATDRMSVIVVYADGSVREYGVKRGVKYRDIYRDKVLNVNDGLQLKYLTPTGEVFVGR